MGWEEWATKAKRRSPVAVLDVPDAPVKKRPVRTFDQAIITAFYRLHLYYMKRRPDGGQFAPCATQAYPVLSRTEPILQVSCPMERLWIARGGDLGSA